MKHSKQRNELELRFALILLKYTSHFLLHPLYAYIYMKTPMANYKMLRFLVTLLLMTTSSKSSIVDSSPTASKPLEKITTDFDGQLYSAGERMLLQVDPGEPSDEEIIQDEMDEKYNSQDKVQPDLDSEALSSLSQELFDSAAVDNNNNYAHSWTNKHPLMMMSSSQKVVDFISGTQISIEDTQDQTFGPVGNETLEDYIRHNCTSCLLREEAKLARIERVKVELLHKLGLKNPPNSTMKTLPPMLPHLNDLLNKWGFNAHSGLLSDSPYVDRDDLRPEDDSAKLEQIYIIGQKPTESLKFNEIDDDMVYFQISQETQSNFIESAQLHFYVRSDQISSDTNPAKIIIYQYNDASGDKRLIKIKEFKRQGRFKGHWDKIDITSSVRLWFSKPERNYGLLIQTVNNNISLTFPPPVKITDADKYTTYLNVAVRDMKAHRRKREIPRMNCGERDNETRCCRFPLVIDFESFGWDWVIAPKKYLAYYCSGECPFRHLQRYLHTHLVQQSNPRGNIGPCCYPTQMAPILMVYFNENKEVLVSKIPGMVVSRCGCA
ncbi:Growth/differentiation factor 8 [Trichinella patagoniensis]|uniref:Growth/differentiation factor 8 n=5 Tax=Trichinella TaxID=6333 RepID=A0A0V1A3C4_9BILA|nr:Growth/differentiation factor 8 [Trichinella patagoniensis]